MNERGGKSWNAWMRARPDILPRLADGTLRMAVMFGAESAANEWRARWGHDLEMSGATYNVARREFLWPNGGCVRQVIAHTKDTKEVRGAVWTNYEIDGSVHMENAVEWKRVMEMMKR